MQCTESWFKDTQNSSSYGFPGFILHRVDRAWVDDELEYDEDGNPKTGGGVCTYIRDDIYHDVYDLSHLNQSCSNIEIQCIRIEKPNNKRVVLVNTYRPPRGCKIEFLRLLKETLTNIPERNKI